MTENAEKALNFHTVRYVFVLYKQVLLVMNDVIIK